MKEATAKCLRDAFCAGSMAQVRYLLYAEKAGEEGFPSVARMFVALAQSRYTQAIGQYLLVNELIGTRATTAETYFTFERTMDNMERARDAEKDDAGELLPAYRAVAESQCEEVAAKNLKRSAEVCRNRAALLDDVIQRTRHAAEEPKISVLYVCRTCGYVTIVEGSEGCPVCGNERSGFITVA
jgi:rubrerythrin